MLQFQVHLKESQNLIYLNRKSTHSTFCFKAITKGIFKRLAKFTTANGSNKLKQRKELYLDHCKALENANITVPNTMLKEQLIFDNNKTRKERHKDPWYIYFCIGYSQVWEKPISKVIYQLIKSFDLT